jgi:hypothetical protein
LELRLLLREQPSVTNPARDAKLRFAPHDRWILLVSAETEPWSSKPGFSVRLGAGRPPGCAAPRRIQAPLFRWTPDASVRSSMTGFDSRQGYRRGVRTHMRLITSCPQVRLLPLLPRRLLARGGSHKAGHEGSTPSVATEA